jgi:hypothetical protein
VAPLGARLEKLKLEDEDKSSSEEIFETRLRSYG